MLDWIQTPLSLIFPPRCLGCGTMVDSDFGLCGPCWRDTPFIGGTVCDACGAPMPGQSDSHEIACDDCMKTPRPWAMGRAVLLYKGRGRQMVLSLKHGDQTQIANPAGPLVGAGGDAASAARYPDCPCANALVADVAAQIQPVCVACPVNGRYREAAYVSAGLAADTQDREP